MSRIQVRSIHATNFGPIAELQADFETHDVLIVKGGNGRGKSTFIEGFFAVLRQKFPDCPLKQGTTSGGMSISLSDGTEIVFDAASKTLTVSNEAGKMGANSAKDYLRRLLGNYGGGFSINDFIQTTAPKQRLEMLKTLTLQSGSDLSAIDRANNTYKSAFDDRTEAARLRDAQKARIAPFDPEKAEQSPVDAAELATQKQSILDHNAKFERAKEKINEHEAAASDWASVAEKTRLEIERLQATMAQQKENESAAREKVKAGNDWINNPENQPRDTSAIDAQLQALTETNEAISAAKRMKAEQEKLDQLEAEYSRKNDAVARANDARKAAIAACALPAGLKFDESGQNLLLNDLPLESASAAEKTVVAIQLQLSQMGELGFVSCDLSHLDPEKLEYVVSWMRENGLQAAIEIAARTKSEMGLQVQIFEDYIE